MGEITIDFPDSKGGLHCTQFENIYAANAEAILAPENEKVIFRFEEKIFYGIDAALRLLTLCNYLVLQGKMVTLVFEGLIPVGKGYLERIGFFEADRLHPSVEVLPYRILGTSSAVNAGRIL